MSDFIPEGLTPEYHLLAEKIRACCEAHTHQDGWTDVRPECEEDVPVILMLSLPDYVAMDEDGDIGRLSPYSSTNISNYVYLSRYTKFPPKPPDNQPERKASQVGFPDLYALLSHITKLAQQTEERP